MGYQYPDPPRRRNGSRGREVAPRKRDPIMVNTKLADNLRRGAVEMEEIAVFLQKGGFDSDAMWASELGEDVRRLARSIESRISAYGKAVRDTPEEPRTSEKPKHCI